MYEKLYIILKNIAPTSVSSEQAFSVAGSFVPNRRLRLSLVISFFAKNKNFFAFFALKKIFRNSLIVCIFIHHHSSWQPILALEKSPSKSTYIESKVHIVATWGSVKQKNLTTSFEGLVVLRLEYPPIWADRADHANYYLPKESSNFFV